MQKHYTCIMCPKGCSLILDTQSMLVTGNSCPKGEEYAVSEYTCPKRVVTATVVCDGLDSVKRIPVKTDAPIDMKLIDALLSDLYQLHIAAPVAVGDVVIQDYKQTGVNVVVTRSISNQNAK